MATERWRQVRELFDAICELPREQWSQALDTGSDDPAVREEVLQLLRSQTVGLSRVSNRLDTALARALAPELGVGERLGPWRLTERIAHGGMGTVFKAERADGLYQRMVAIKLLHGMPGATEVELLGAERQVLAGLQLSNVARLYDGGTTPDGYPYLVMEYIDGVPLDCWCAEQGLGLQQRLVLFLEICSIVQSAHEQLVLHCDLKPPNVLVQANGQPVLLDFGLARLLNEARDKRDSGYCTPGYASPELIAGHSVGAASDVYSLGVMLLELLSTQPSMREAQNTGEALIAPSANTPADLPWRRRLRGDLDAIVARACASDISLRYRSVEALMADLRRYLEMQPVLARNGGRLYHLGKALRRNWQGTAIGVGATALLAVFVFGLWETRRQAQEEAVVAQQISNFMVGMFETADPFLRTERGAEELSSRQLLDKATLQVARDLADAPAQLARLRAVLGVAYQNAGASHQADTLLQQAYAGFMDPRVARPLDAANVLADLSVQKTLDGDGEQGRQLAEQGLQLIGSKAPAVVQARLYSAKGLALVNQQHFDLGEAAFNSATALYQNVRDVDVSAEKSELSYNKGLMYLRWGRQASAEQEFRQMLDNLHGRRTSLALAAETRLAQILREQGKYEQALPLLQTGMQYALELYGAESSFVRMQYDGLADLYRDSGDYAAAEQHYQKRNALSARLDGQDSVEYSMGLFNYGSLKVLRGELAAGEALYRQSWMIRKQKLGEDSPTSLRAESELARLLMRDGRMEEAGVMLMHADNGLSKSLPADAPGRVQAHLNRIDWHVRSGQLAQARQLLERMGVPVADELQLRLLGIRADLAVRQGEGELALTLRKAALELASSRQGKDSAAVVEASLALAESLLQLGHARMAKEELQRVLLLIGRLQVAGSPDRRKLDGLLLLAEQNLSQR
ncbi:serine/threonine-protein kinase [Stenotrophomonas sp. PS02298]|uniref:serine/threonine-protein kinase n=1 Tax=Stenotrophomonas sp. PS02298 TaxID=2991424 RepID=UPI00249AB186|nr:serine/threonine-protein kinase [Stenotrophomonas sp. PS02298]